MTKVLNNLLITGTNSTSQALGVTSGNLNVMNKVTIGTWEQQSDDLFIQSSGSNTNPLRVRDSTNFRDILTLTDNGSLTLLSTAPSVFPPILQIGFTAGSQFFQSLGVLGIGALGSTGGVRIHANGTFSNISSRSGQFGFSTASIVSPNFSPLLLDITSTSFSEISSDISNDMGIRISSGGGDLILSTRRRNIPGGTTFSRLDRLTFTGTTFSNVQFGNISRLSIEDIGIVSRNVGTSSASYPNTFIIGNSSSSINISTTFSLPVSWGQEGIIIAPSSTVSMTASNFPISGGVHTNNSNILVVSSLDNIPTNGNYNVILGGQSKITTGSFNVGVGNGVNNSTSTLGDLTIGNANTAIGGGALSKITTGDNNTAIGGQAMGRSSQSIEDNVSIGNQSGQFASSSNNIFIGSNAGRHWNGTGSVIYLSSHKFTDSFGITGSPQWESTTSHYSTRYVTWSGLPPIWATSPNFGNVVLIGNESSGGNSNSNLDNIGTYRSIFFGKGMWHLSRSLNTYIISTSLPTLQTWTSSNNSPQPNNNAPGSSLELVAGPGRGGGTAGDLYFSTGVLTASGNNLQDKSNRLTIKGGSGFIGIGPGTFSNNPTNLLHIWGTSSGSIRIQDGSQASGRVLTSDSNGVGTWQTLPPGLTGGTNRFIPLFTGVSSLTSSGIYQGSSGSIVIGYTQSHSQFDTRTDALLVRGDVYFDNNTPSSNKFFLNGTYLFDDIVGNLALGLNALRGNSFSASRTGNVAIGYQSLTGMTSGQSNISIGYNNMLGANNVNRNVSIGFESLLSVSSNGNISLGNASGVSYLTTESGTNGSNIFIGDNSARGFTRGNFNTFITSNVSNMGTASNIGITGGSNNIIIGQLIGISQSSRNGNVIIGNSMSVRGGLTGSIILSDGFGRERMFINESGNIAIGTHSASHRLTIWGSVGSTASFRLVDGNQAAGRVLVSDGDGVAQWGNPTTYFSGSGLTMSGFTFSVFTSTQSGLTSSINGGVSVNVSRGITISSNSVGLISRTISQSNNFSITSNDWGNIFEVTTGNNLITASPPGASSVPSGFYFIIKKVDRGNGAVLANGVYEFESGSGNFSYVTRLNQSIKYVSDGVNWKTIYLDEGALSPSSVFGNIAATWSHGDVIPITDINDPIRETINYTQGSLINDWLSGVIYSAYQPITLSQPANQSMFNTATNSFIGTTSSPTTIPAYGMKLGKSYRIQLFGTYSITNGSFTLLPRIANTNLSTSTFTSATAANIPFYIDYVLKCIAVGASGSVHGSGIWISQDNPNDVNKYRNIMGTSSFGTSVNTTTANNIGFLVNRTGGTVSMTVIHSTIERLS